MATFTFNAQYRWPLGVDLTSQSWLAGGGQSGVFSVFASAQNMNNPGVRSSLFNTIKSTIEGALVNPLTTVQNQTWSQVTVNLQTFNQWEINIEGNCDNLINDIAICPSYALSPVTQTNVIYGVVINAITTCDTCQPLTVKACQTSYTLTTGLTPATIYTVALQAVNGNTYTQEVTSDGSGNITIDTTASGFPEGLFIPESGGYIVKVYANSTLTTPLTIKVGSTEYTCINLNFTYVTTT